MDILDFLLDILLKPHQPLMGLFLGGLSLHLNCLIASHVANYNWPFGTLPFDFFAQIWTQGTLRYIIGLILVIFEICHFLGGLSLHLNHLIASHVANYNWPFATLPFGLFCSNLDTRDLEIYHRTNFGHF